MNTFKKSWIQKTHDIPIQEELDDVKEMVHEMDERLDQYETASGTKKTQVEKPGESIHSAKWDNCVADVGQDPNVNAYAVCTAQLGEESFKSFDTMTKSEIAQVQEEVSKVLTILSAGEIPVSLLARQDLEPTSSSEKIGVNKGIIEEANKMLDEVKEDAKDAEETTEKQALVENIKAIQLKRQKAEIYARKGQVSFKNAWNKIYGK